MVQKQITKDGSFSLEQLCDMLMWDIEPELVTFNLHALPEKYAHETAEEKKKRATRYARALQELEDKLTKLLGIWKEQVVGYKDKILTAVREASEGEDRDDLSTIEHSIEDL